MADPEIIVTGDGSHTLFLKGLNEHYHSIHGAVRESEHVFIGYGFKSAATGGRKELKVLEAGFGTGLNALLTFLKAEEMGVKVAYTGIDLYPLSNSIISSLNYPGIISGDGVRDWFLKIAGSGWNKVNEIKPGMQLEKISIDLREYSPIPESYDVVYFDAFAPDVQPELWTKSVLEKFARPLRPGGVFVTYSCKGKVRRDLTESGLKVRRVPGPPGKREMLQGLKPHSIPD
jgi:tRNA U34 5-methylaminomethyl-2-thiouridine-forming methyltransferase MnmC